MASLKETLRNLGERLKSAGIGVKGELQLQREADPYLMAMMNRQPLPARTQRNAPIEERYLEPYEDMYGEPRRPNRTQFSYPEYEPNYDVLSMPPVSPSATTPIRRDVTAPRQRDISPIPEQVSMQPPVMPDVRQVSDTMQAPTAPVATLPQRRRLMPPSPRPRPRPEMTPQVEKPSMDNVVENLMARYEGLYGEEPQRPQLPGPERRPVPLPDGVPISPQSQSPYGMRPEIDSPNVQPYRPASLFGGMFPTLRPKDYDFYGLENIPILSGFDTDLPPNTTIDEEGRLVYEIPPGTSIDLDGNLIDEDTNKILIPNYKPTPVSNFR